MSRRWATTTGRVCGLWRMPTTTTSLVVTTPTTTLSLFTLCSTSVRRLQTLQLVSTSSRLRDSIVKMDLTRRTSRYSTSTTRLPHSHSRLVPRTACLMLLYRSLLENIRQNLSISSLRLTVNSPWVQNSRTTPTSGVSGITSYSLTTDQMLISMR